MLYTQIYGYMQTSFSCVQCIPNVQNIHTYTLLTILHDSEYQTQSDGTEHIHPKLPLCISISHVMSSRVCRQAMSASALSVWSAGPFAL